jgi:hypothetical protein
MKYIFLFLFMVLGLSAFSQVKPSNFSEEANPNNTNFEVYSQKGGVNKRASLLNLKRYFAPLVFGTISYVPATSGNPSNRMEFVTDPDGATWYIDANGAAIKLSGTGGGLWTWQTTVYTVGQSVFTVTTPPPSDLKKIRVLRNGLEYRLGTTGCTSCQVALNTTTNQFLFTRPMAGNETVEVQYSN